MSQDVPLCPSCTQRYLSFDEDGEAILQPSLNGTLLPRFHLGQIVLTPEAKEALARAGQDAEFFLKKHAGGDYGDIAEDDQKSNQRALKEGGRLVSMFLTLRGEAILIITEADRSVTTLMLPEEY